MNFWNMETKSSKEIPECWNWPPLGTQKEEHSIQAPVELLQKVMEEMIEEQGDKPPVNVNIYIDGKKITPK